jgi:hypothetical protein
VLAARLALESSPAGQAGQPWWRSVLTPNLDELRAALPATSLPTTR